MKKLIFFIALFTPGILAIAQSSYIQRVDSLHKVLLKAPIDTNRVNVYYDISNIYVRNNIDSAIKYATFSLRLADRLRSARQMANAYNLLGVIQRGNGTYEQAIISFQKAIPICEATNQLNTLTKVYSNMGDLYRMMGETQNIRALYEKSLEYLLKADEILKKTRNTRVLIANYGNLGLSYWTLKDYQHAYECYQKGIELEEKTHKHPEALPSLFLSMANYQLAIKRDPESAIGYLQKAEIYCDKYNNTITQAAVYEKLSEAYRDKKDPANALKYAEKVLVLAQRIKNLRYLAKAYRQLYLSYVLADNPPKALSNFEKYKMADDSLLSVEKTRQIVNLQKEFELKKEKDLAIIEATYAKQKAYEAAEIKARYENEKARQLAEVQKQAEVNKAAAIAEIETRYETQKKESKIKTLGTENQLKTRQMAYLFGGLLILSALIGVLLWQYTKIRESRKLISRQSDDLKLMMRELHHRVKNNLAIVSSLLKIQSDKLQDEKAVLAVMEGQQRVEAMSLIHQRLYLTDKVTNINIKEYITDLSESLMNAYGFSPDKFNLQLNIEKEELDVDLAIPLGLIINELLTNAFKYAYEKVADPLLKINLTANDNLTLEIQDNGPGIDMKRWQKDKDSFGKNLIKGLSKQTGGQFSVENNQGAYFKLVIPKARYKMAA